MSIDNRNKLTTNDWKKIILGFIASFAIYFILTVISYRFYNCSSDDIINDFECITSIPPYEKIYLILFSLIFGFFIQEIDDALFLIGYNVLATVSAMVLLSFYVQLVTDGFFLSDTFVFIFFNFRLIFVSSLFGQGLSNVIYSIINDRNSKNYKKDYVNYSEIE